jgi:hypothetical protein
MRPSIKKKVRELRLVKERKWVKKTPSTREKELLPVASREILCIP